MKNCRVHPTHWLISTQATTLTKFMGTMVLCDTSSAAITVTLPAASDMSEQSGASHRPVWK